MVTVKDEKEKVKTRREKIAGRYLDMSLKEVEIKF